MAASMTTETVRGSRARRALATEIRDQRARGRDNVTARTQAIYMLRVERNEREVCDQCTDECPCAVHYREAV